MVNRKTYFWRTYAGAEIDLEEETGNQLLAFEIKYRKARSIAPKAWVNFK
jgi:hypothetical protein